jgi:hypothetical protein
MTQTAILEELNKLTTRERLELIEAAIHQLQEDFQKIEQPLTRTERKQQLTAAAEALLPDYEKDDELTSFTALDGEAFHA